MKVYSKKKIVQILTKINSIDYLGIDYLGSRLFGNRLFGNRLFGYRLFGNRLFGNKSSNLVHNFCIGIKYYIKYYTIHENRVCIDRVSCIV